MKLITAAAVSAFCALAGPSAAMAAPAQSPAPPAAEPKSGEEIVVTGTRLGDREISDFLGALVPGRINGQVSRFDWEVCPTAVGLSPAQNAAVVDRMRKVAGAAGIRVADAKCKPNVMVIVAKDKAAVVQQLNKKYPAYFNGMSPGQVRKLAGTPRASAWHVEGMLSADGTQLTKDLEQDYYVNESTVDPSRLRASSRPHFIGSVVVVELSALAGLSTTQFADYAALRTFARTDPSRLDASRAPTILTILDQPMGSEVPMTLTKWDMSFLTSLYSAPDNQFAGRQRSEMKREFKKELGQADAQKEQEKR